MIYLINELKETDFGRNNQETVSTKNKSVMWVYKMDIDGLFRDNSFAILTTKQLLIS